MPFASALSEHPVASQATGEVVGAVFEEIGDRPDLIVVLVTRPHAGALEDIAAAVATLLRPLVLIGGSARSVVGMEREVEETPAISLWAGRVGPLAPVSLSATRIGDDRWHFEGWPVSLAFEPTVLALLADPFTFPADAFFAWLERVHPGLPVVGGNLSGGRGPGGNHLVSGTQVRTEGATGVLIGTGVDVRPVVSQGCQACGSDRTVTRSDRNLIYEVAGAPATEWLVEQLRGTVGPEDVTDIRSNGLFVGRLIDDRIDRPGPGDYLIRKVVGVDRSIGAVAVAGRMPLGSTVRLHLRDADTAHRDLAHLLEGREAEAGLLFACRDRGTRLFGRPDHDARLVARSIGPTALGGMLSVGEFGPVGGRNFVHRSSVAVTLFD